MLLKRKYLFGTTVLAGAIAFSGAAFAQSTTTTTQDEEADQSTQIEDVVVVGSRIRRDVYNSPSPVQVITREESTLAGLASTTEILQGTAVSGGNAQINNLYTGFVTNGGPGVNTIGLRGLGPSRTLVLLNGRRVAPAGSRGSVGSADLNVLPSALIERIEVLRDGASSIYGSDAVAGVINIVTRNNMEGLSFEAGHYATTDANGGGDQTRISLSGGLQNDRWSLIGSIERYEREAILLGDRPFAQCPTAGFLGTNPNYVDYIDPMTGRSKCFSLDNGGVTINTLGLSTRAAIGAPGSLNPGALGSFNRFRPNGAVTAGLSGFEGVGGAGAPNTSVRDTFDPRMLEGTLFSPVATTTAFAGLTYDLGGAELYYEILANRRESSQQDYRQLSLDYSVGNLLIPANLGTGPAFAAADTANNITGGAPIQARAFVGYGLYGSDQTVDFLKNTIGVRGDLGFRDWSYDVYASYTTSESTYTYEQHLKDRLTNSLDVVLAPVGTPAHLTRTGLGSTGQMTVTCRVNTLNPNANCIPAPFLDANTIGGRLPENWTNYFDVPVTGVTKYDETVVSGGISGSLFTLPAGDVQFFVGAEYRTAEIDDTPSADMQNGNLYNFSTSEVTRGTDSVTEVFGEVELPLLANMPFAEELTLSASARWTDYDSYGDDTTYKIGLNYRPVDWVLLRATYGTSYRAPALFEQFKGPEAGFAASSGDPCNNWGAPSVNPNRKVNCASEGIIDTFLATGSVRVLGAGGAAQGLTAETSSNFTGGVVINAPIPDSFGRLSLAVDYYEIELEDSVTQYGSAYILSQCYNSSAAEFTADAGFCQFVTRDAPGTSRNLTVRNNYVNVATNYVEGIDYNLRYTNNDVFGGTLTANLAVGQYLDRWTKLFSNSIIYSTVGTIANPEYTAQASVSYAINEWRFRWGVEWVDAATDEYDQQARNGYSLLNDFGIDTFVDEYFNHNASVQWAKDDLQLTVGIRNVFNENPPESTGYWHAGIGNSPLISNYDFTGRMVFINVGKQF